jgi:hypothetical protein
MGDKKSPNPSPPAYEASLKTKGRMFWCFFALMASVMGAAALWLITH